MPELAIRPKRADDDEWIVSLRNRLSNHLPPSSLTSFRHWEQVDKQTDQAHVERYVAEMDGNRVGASVLEKMWWTKREGGFWGIVQIDPDLWNKGMGAQMYDHLQQRITDLGADRWYAIVREDFPIARHFSEARGFTETGHSDRFSRLEVATANLEGYEGLDAKLAGEGIVIQTLEDTGQSDDFLKKLHRVSDEAVRDIPMSEEFTETPFEMFKKELEDPNLGPDRVFVALEGQEPVGLAIFPTPTPTTAFNGFTGTARSHRGKGVARALKGKTVEWSKDNGVEYIYTANDVNNKRMLAINIRLGYQPLPSSQEVVKNLSKE